MKKEKVEEKTSLSKALWRIAASVLIVSLPVYLATWGYQFYQERLKSNARFQITTLVQTGPEREALRTVYLAEILGLSKDKPTNLYRFSIPIAQQRLLSCPVIWEAKVEKMPPDTLYVDYSVRRPFALLYDYTNTAIDKKGYIFPLSPFFTPKRLPEIYLGLCAYGQNGNAWGQPLKGEKVDLALNVLLQLTRYAELFRVLRVDVSTVGSESYGQRQIVVILEDQKRKEEPWGLTTYLFPRMLRLPIKNYEEAIVNYLQMRDRIIEEELATTSLQKPYLTTVHLAGRMIDLRLPDMAYIK